MDLVIFLPFLALFGVIIYMQTRQRKKLLARQTELQASLSVGAQVMLTCGLHGEVAGLSDDTVDVEIAPGVVSVFARAAVLEVRSAETTDTTTDTEHETNVRDSNNGGATATPAKPRAHDDPSA